MDTARVPRSTPLLALIALTVGGFAGAFPGGLLCEPVFAQTMGSALPATAPTQLGSTSPLSGSVPSGGRPRHHAQVSCSNGMLTVRADNSSLNSILRSIAQCTGMKITGGVIDQRVFGSYGPAAPSTVLATLIDGTNTNMLLQETAADQPAELILTPRMGGASPPGPSTVPEDAMDDNNTAAPNQPVQNQPVVQSMQPMTPSQPMGNTNDGGTSSYSGQANQTPVPQPYNGSAVTGPVPIPQPMNNVNGSPSNTSPTASSYPTTDSVSSDSLPTPSTTPSSDGIVDAPNPPAKGSDTDRLLHGGNANNPGTINILSPNPISNSTQPDASNTATPVPNGAIQPGAGSSTGMAAPNSVLSPEQVYQQLQQMRQRQVQSQSPQTPDTQQTQPAQTQAPATPQPQ